MDTVSRLLAVFASWAPLLTDPTFHKSGRAVARGVLSPGSRTVTACLVAAWPLVGNHWSAYANVVRRARLPMLVMARVFSPCLATSPAGAAGGRMAPCRGGERAASGRHKFRAAPCLGSRSMALQGAKSRGREIGTLSPVGSPADC